jgi:hypothetical protein
VSSHVRFNLLAASSLPINIFYAFFILYNEVQLNYLLLSLHAAFLKFSLRITDLKKLCSTLYIGWRNVCRVINNNVKLFVVTLDEM